MKHPYQIILANNSQFIKNMLNQFNDSHYEEGSLDNYDIAYSSLIEVDDSVDIMQIPEILFEKFNTDHPDDYKHRSLSVGDMVCVDCVVFYCKTVGFEIVKSLTDDLSNAIKDIQNSKDFVIAENINIGDE